MHAVAGLVVAVCAPRECQPAPEQPVRITVVTVLATGANRTVDERLAELAKEVEKRDKGLTGFKLHASEAKLDSVAFKRARHVVEEIARVDACVQALQSGE